MKNKNMVVKNCCVGKALFSISTSKSESGTSTHAIVRGSNKPRSGPNICLTGHCIVFMCRGKILLFILLFVYNSRIVMVLYFPACL